MEENKSKAWGVTSLVTGILSLILFLLPYFGFPLAIVAIVANAKQKKIKELGIGTAGMICGIIGLIFNVIVGFFVLIALLVGGMF